MRLLVTVVLFFYSLLMWAPSLSAQDEGYSVSGVVRDLYSQRPLTSVVVGIAEVQKNAVTDTAGYYKIAGLKKNIYSITFTLIGHKKLSRKISFEGTLAGKAITLSVKMEEQALMFEPTEVTPGVIEMSSEEGASSTVSSQEIISSAGIFTKDVYRSLQVVPGVSNSEWSSKPHIKGGSPDETAVLIDNLEIYEPFHLDEIDGPFSVINSDLVKDMKMLTGGFAPKFGDKMSGILKINTFDKLDDDSIKVSLDYMSAAGSLHQRINDRLNVFFSGRRSFNSFIEKASGTKFPTVVYDLWSKADYKLDSKNKLSLNFMMLNDQIQYAKDSTVIRKEFFNSAKLNYYVWGNWSCYVNENRYFTTTLGYQTLNKHSDFSFDGSLSSDNLDNRSTKLATLKQDHYWKLSDTHTLEFGGQVNGFSSDYLYHELRLNPTETSDFAVSIDILDVNKQLNGYMLAGYVQDTYKYSKQLNLLYGFRISGQNYSGSVQVAPRAAVSYSFTEDLNLKLAYGWYFQPDNFQKMKTYENVSTLQRKPEKSYHYVANLTYAIDHNTTANTDVYYKNYIRLYDDFNFDFSNRIDGVGIVTKPFNTQSGYSTGLDLFLRHRYGRANLISLAYSWSSVIIRDSKGDETYRDLDRTHALTLSNIFNFSHGLTVSGMFRIHTGDPYTPSAVRILGDSLVTDSRIYYITQKKNSARLPVFHSLDLRADKRWDLNNMYLVTYAGVINLLNHRNVRQKLWVRRVVNDKITNFVQEDQVYFPRFFSLGVSLEFSLPRSK
jgi:hypothetical protein